MTVQRNRERAVSVGNIAVGEWYYIGHYGQLGPLTREQIDELIEGEVISRDTYVWKQGMGNWVYAGQLPELLPKFQTHVPAMDPPPPPDTSAAGPFRGQPMSGAQSRTYTSSAGQGSLPRMGPAYSTDPRMSPAPYPNQPTTFVALRSNKSRIAGGVLQFVIPGIGRMYMGYWGIGILQFLLTAFCGVGALWSYIDAIVILTGGVKIDGYGRVLCD